MYVRKCASAKINTGKGKCQIPKGKIKGLILVQRGYTLPEVLTMEALEVAEHADRPYRIYPINTVEEYTPSGGEAQYSQQGYGSNNLTNYSPLQEAFTLDKRDIGLVANLMKAKNAKLDVYLVNSDNVIFGEEDVYNNFVGIPISSISIGGQQHNSSGQVASLDITISYKDVEAHWKREAIRTVDFDIMAMMHGLVDVTFSPVGTGNTGFLFKLIENYSKNDITASYGQLIINNLAESIPESFVATLITNQEELDDMIGSGISKVPVIDITDLTNSYSSLNIPQLAEPSVLYTLGITGIAQEIKSNTGEHYALLADENGDILTDENDLMLIG